MTNKLCDKLLNGKEQNRHIASIALKTIVAEVPNSSVEESVLVSISPKLIRGIVTHEICTEIKCECLDILCGVLHKYVPVIFPVLVKAKILEGLSLQRGGDFQYEGNTLEDAVYSM
ncbi:cullin-associated and neddylation dissociated [Perilla frutescens var. hirtella]|nr:cullin-associated and neddylation dissociated [Perilla frutescens var. hirtella]